MLEIKEEKDQQSTKFAVNTRVKIQDREDGSKAN